MKCCRLSSLVALPGFRRTNVGLRVPSFSASPQKIEYVNPDERTYSGPPFEKSRPSRKFEFDKKVNVTSASLLASVVAWDFEPPQRSLLPFFLDDIEKLSVFLKILVRISEKQGVRRLSPSSQLLVQSVDLFLGTFPEFFSNVFLTRPLYFAEVFWCLAKLKRLKFSLSLVHVLLLRNTSSGRVLRGRSLSLLLFSAAEARVLLPPPAGSTLPSVTVCPPPQKPCSSGGSEVSPPPFDPIFHRILTRLETSEEGAGNFASIFWILVKLKKNENFFEMRTAEEVGRIVERQLGSSLERFKKESGGFSNTLGTGAEEIGKHSRSTQESQGSSSISENDLSVCLWSLTVVAANSEKFGGIRGTLEHTARFIWNSFSELRKRNQRGQSPPLGGEMLIKVFSSGKFFSLFDPPSDFSREIEEASSSLASLYFSRICESDTRFLFDSSVGHLGPYLTSAVLKKAGVGGGWHPANLASRKLEEERGHAEGVRRRRARGDVLAVMEVRSVAASEACVQRHEKLSFFFDREGVVYDYLQGPEKSILENISISGSSKNAENVIPLNLKHNRQDHAEIHFLKLFQDLVFSESLINDSETNDRHVFEVRLHVSHFPCLSCLYCILRCFEARKRGPWRAEFEGDLDTGKKCFNEDSGEEPFVFFGGKGKRIEIFLDVLFGFSA